MTATALAAVGSNANENGTLLISGTAVSASGTSVDFPNIPSWAKRITVMFSGVSLSGSASCLVQIGTGGTATTSGYTGAFGVITSAPITSCSALSTGFTIQTHSAATQINAFLTIANITGNTWVANGGFAETLGARAGYITGAVSLSGALNYLRVTTTNGTDTFDAGTINIMWE